MKAVTALKGFLLLCHLCYMGSIYSEHTTPRTREEVPKLSLTQRMAKGLLSKEKAKRISTISALAKMGPDGNKQIAQRVELLINQLNHPSYTVREKAQSMLWEFGPHADPWLKKAAESTNPERAQRARKLLPGDTIQIDPSYLVRKLTNWVTKHPDIDELTKVSTDLLAEIPPQTLDRWEQKDFLLRQRIDSGVFDERKQWAWDLRDELKQVAIGLGYKVSDSRHPSQMKLTKGNKTFHLSVNSVGSSGIMLHHSSSVHDSFKSVPLSQFVPKATKLENGREITFKLSPELAQKKVNVAFSTQLFWSAPEFRVQYYNREGNSMEPLNISHILGATDRTNPLVDNPVYFRRPLVLPAPAGNRKQP